MKKFLKYFVVCLVIISVFCGTTTQTAFAATLRQGSKGSAVRWLQRNLTGIGFPCTVDGGFGSNTKARVKEVQRYFGISVDGQAGSQTQSKIKGLISEIQRNLKKHYLKLKNMLIK